MSWSGLVKICVGLFLAIALLAGGSLVAAQYFIAKLSAPPPKPIYPNDKPIAPPKTAAKSKAVEKPEAQSDTLPSKPLPSGAFAGRVTQPIGLILRDAPGRDSSQIGGIDFNNKVFVLETSADGDWQKVRLQTGDREGWVKSGNVDKVTP